MYDLIQVRIRKSWIHKIQSWTNSFSSSPHHRRFRRRFRWHFLIHLTVRGGKLFFPIWERQPRGSMCCHSCQHVPSLPCVLSSTPGSSSNSVTWVIVVPRQIEPPWLLDTWVTSRYFSEVMCCCFHVGLHGRIVVCGLVSVHRSVEKTGGVAVRTEPLCLVSTQEWGYWNDSIKVIRLLITDHFFKHTLFCK